MTKRINRSRRQERHSEIERCWCMRIH